MILIIYLKWRNFGARRIWNIWAKISPLKVNQFVTFTDRMFQQIAVKPILHLQIMMVVYPKTFWNILHVRLLK